MNVSELHKDQIQILKSESFRTGLWREVYLRSYHKFFLDAWHTVTGETLNEGRHIKVVCDELQAVGERVIKRQPKLYDLIINIPPGFTKSTMATVLFPSWLWARDASLQIISSSHSNFLSTYHASLSRDCINSEFYKKFFGDLFQIRPDFDAKHLYKNTEGGFRYATSIGSRIVGQHGHLILIDDPFDPSEVHSLTKLEDTNHYINNRLFSRVVNKKVTPFIMIMQRLHEIDPTGYWLKYKKNVRHICLPATDDYPIHPNEYKSLYVNGYLDNERAGEDILEPIKVTMTALDYAAQYGQQPRAQGGNIVSDEMLPVFHYSDLPQAVKDKVLDFVVDTADKDKERNDFSAWMAYCEYMGYLFIFAFERHRGRFSDRVEHLRKFVKLHGNANSRVFIEPRSSGVAISQFLQDHSDLNVFEWEMPRGSKTERLQAITPFLDQKKAVLIYGPWNSDFKNEVTLFPNAVHDEAVDLLSMAGINTFLRKSTQPYRRIL